MQILESKDYLCGIDEAGRGCIAGSLFVACVLMKQKYKNEFLKLGIKDSKQLNHNERNALGKEIFSFLQKHEGSFQILQYTSEQIDNNGLSWCMKNALVTLRDFANSKNCKNIIFDGNTNFGVKDILTLIKGDSKEVFISAASILAKNKKDEEMLFYDSVYPEYDFKNNKGYLTKKHKDSLMRHGYCEIHRKSYTIKSLHLSPTLFS